MRGRAQALFLAATMRRALRPRKRLWMPTMKGIVGSPWAPAPAPIHLAALRLGLGLGLGFGIGVWVKG